MITWTKWIQRTLATAVLACGFGATEVNAGFVVVSSDAGTFNFTLTSTGSGSFAITYSNALLTTINSLAIPTGAISDTVIASPETSVVNSVVSASPLTTYTLSSANPFEKSFGAGPGQIQVATLQYQLTSGEALNPSFLNLSGIELAPISPLLQTTATGSTIYDFSLFSHGGTISRTFTSVGANFANVIASGGTIIGTGAFSDIATVPEPSSMALVVIGLSGIIAFRCALKRPVAA